MVLKLLAVGDIHLGREPSRIPSGTDKSLFRPSTALTKVVDFAIANQVAAVLLAGDVVDDDESVFEALSCLRRLGKRLADNGIDFCAVAGNHDVRILPRIAKKLGPTFSLLGAGGKWECKEIHRRQDAVALWGWSFPDERIEYSPLVDASIKPIPKMPNIGILHCDLDKRLSPYAPVASSELRAQQLDRWVLGHVHRPDKLDTELCGYLGSLTPLSSKETGAHGPWFLCIEDGCIQKVCQLQMAALRWEQWEIDITTCTSKEEIEDKYLGRIDEYNKNLPKDSWCCPEEVCLQLTLVGRGKYGKDYVACVEQGTGVPVSLDHVGDHKVKYFVDRVENMALPEVDMAKLAAGDDPPGLLAKRLLAFDKFLKNDSPMEGKYEYLIEQATERIETQGKRMEWKAVNHKFKDEKAVVQQLHMACLELLHAMLAQNPGEDRR